MVKLQNKLQEEALQLKLSTAQQKRRSGFVWIKNGTVCCVWILKIKLKLIPN